MAIHDNSPPKKTWVRPQLTVLTRAQSEEAVLASCKGSWVLVGGGPFGVSCSDLNTFFCNQPVTS